MLAIPMVHVEAIDRDTLNRLLAAWGHRMGPVLRPSYAVEAHHALMHHGQPVAVTSAMDTVREVVGQTGIRRQDSIELVRLCAARPHLYHVMLRLWREFVFPALAVAHKRTVAVSYQDADLHNGNTYRFDGWRVAGRAGGGGRDARSGRRGRDLRVWVWPPRHNEPMEAPR